VKSYIFWDVMKCSPVDVNQCFGGTHGLHHFLLDLFLEPEDEGDMFSWKDGWLLPDYTVLYIKIELFIKKNNKYCGTGNRILNTANIGVHHRIRSWIASSTSHRETYRVISKVHLMLSLTLLFGLPMERFPRSFPPRIFKNSQFPLLYLYV
jgi:hypothetical protein